VVLCCGSSAQPECAASRKDQAATYNAGNGSSLRAPERTFDSGTRRAWRWRPRRGLLVLWRAAAGGGQPDGVRPLHVAAWRARVDRGQLSADFVPYLEPTFYSLLAVRYF
jgi:hypothetical protein